MLNAVPAAVPESELGALAELIGQVETVFRGKRETVRLSLAALLARGHLLFEDIPGVGKTTLARASPRRWGWSSAASSSPATCSPPTCWGCRSTTRATHEFETRPGPIFTHVVLADEINRAPPRTQSGLLEAMQEGRVTIDERSFELPRPSW
jgi:MoxR-like ATPase